MKVEYIYQTDIRSAYSAILILTTCVRTFWQLRNHSKICQRSFFLNKVVCTVCVGSVGCIGSVEFVVSVEFVGSAGCVGLLSAFILLGGRAYGLLGAFVPLIC